jgi:surface antigen
MRAGYCSGRVWLFGSVLAVALPAFAPSGYASAETHQKLTHRVVQSAHQARETHQAAVNHVSRGAVRFAAAHGHVIRGRARVVGISCVPYARNASGITLAGNAWEWWDHATGTYARGGVPEPGSVLAFRSNGRMRLGHVAVVTRVVNDREIEIDHANWAGRGVAHGVPVVDVSENNDWTAVRVGLGSAESFGSIYPTYGFIYDRPDTGIMLTAITVPAAQQALTPPARDLRPAPEHTVVTADTLNAREYDEVAEAPAHSRPNRGGAMDRADTASP